ncbi:MAG: type III pantothenate kinase [Rhodospirillaceae bacterium]
MLLTIDSGNTNIVFAVFNDAGDVVGEWRAATKAGRTADEYGIWLRQLLEGKTISPDDIDGAIIATVVPDNLMHLKNLCQKYFGVEAKVVGDPAVNLGIEVLIDNPNEVGTDRLCNAVAAQITYGGPLMIVDFGTATTFDVVDKDGNYRGGVISPGINLSLEALHLGAAQLPRVAVEQPEKVIGTNTVTAMRSGIFWGYVSMIEGMVGRISEEFGDTLIVVGTGGLAPMFQEASSVIEHSDGDLTLRGLFAIYQRNA